MDKMQLIGCILIAFFLLSGCTDFLSQTGDGGDKPEPVDSANPGEIPLPEVPEEDAVETPPTLPF